MTAADLGPRPLLDLAVARVLQADSMQNEIDEGAASMIPTAFETLSIRQESALSVAATLAAVADALVRARADERAANPVVHADLGDEEDADDEPEGLPDDGPHALACRFTATVAGRSFVCGHRDMTFVRGVGWFDMSEETMTGGSHLEREYRLSGRAVSMYRDQVLTVTDGGTALALPAALVTLEADE